MLAKEGFLAVRLVTLKQKAFNVLKKFMQAAAKVLTKYRFENGFETRKDLTISSVLVPTAWRAAYKLKARLGVSLRSCPR